MFFLRCGLWLAVMYAFIAWNGGVGVVPTIGAATVQAQATDVGRAVLARASDWCGQQPARCARDAARLTGLIETTALAAKAAEAEEPARVEVSAPLPLPHPRRRAAHGLLTEDR